MSSEAFLVEDSPGDQLTRDALDETNSRVNVSALQSR